MGYHCPRVNEIMSDQDRTGELEEIFEILVTSYAQKGGVVILLDIIFPIILAFLLFSESPSISAIVGGLLIIVGFFLVTKEEKRNDLPELTPD